MAAGYILAFIVQMTASTTHPAIIICVIYLYFSSERSFRLAAAKCLESMIKRSDVSICKWIQQKYSNCADRFRLERQNVKKIFPFMRDIIIADKWCKDYWLWIAYEPKLK
jgi:hypothetical protein